MKLNRDLLARRLRDVDYRIVSQMQCATMDASGHRSREDARNGVNSITDPRQADSCWFYRVTYRIATLIGPDQRSDPRVQPIIVLVDLNHGGNYPFTAPESFVVGPTTPWSPHFSPGIRICFEVPGHVWTPDGKKTLGDLLRHIAHLINFDERIEDAGYTGWNGPAVQYWRTAMGSRPVTSKLVYPVLPSWVYSQAPGSTARRS